MKEYLVKRINGDYDVVDHHSGFDVSDLIEIPSGAEVYMKGNLYNFFGKYEYKALMVTNKEGIWVKSIYESLTEHNKPILWERKVETKTENLISGKEALIAIANGQEVLTFDTRDSFKSLGWFNAFGLETNLFLGDTYYKFKLKPQIIEANLKLPAPFTPKDGEWCYVTDCGRELGYYAFKFNPHCKNHINYIQFGAYRTEDEIKQVVEAYRGVKGVKNN